MLGFGGCGVTKNLEGRIVTKLINYEACPLDPIRTDEILVKNTRELMQS